MICADTSWTCSFGGACIQVFHAKGIFNGLECPVSLTYGSFEARRLTVDRQTRLPSLRIVPQMPPSCATSIHSEHMDIALPASTPSTYSSVRKSPR